MNNLDILFCKKNTTIIDVLHIFEKAKQHSLPSGIALVLNDNGAVVGTITEGDVRRGLLKYNRLDAIASNIMQSDPILFKEDQSISDILVQIPKELSTRKRNANKYLSKLVIVDHNLKPVRVIDYNELWEQKVASHRHLVVIGLGYVGLTLAAVMADAGFMVTGVEADFNKVNLLKKGNCYIHEVGLTELIKKQIHKNLFVQSEVPEDGDVYIISVGTPVEHDFNGTKRPIMQYLNSACENIGKKLKRGNLVILRSTVPIGTCRNVVKKKLEEISGLSCGIDFHLSFAPERTAEGKALKELRSLPQIIGGFNNDSLEATAAIFRDLTPTIVKVESLEAAEMAKLINNSFRDYIFAFSNQMSKIATKFNMNVIDVIKAANEGYPRDPIPLPSPGVGGPCLTKDPHIFAAVANEVSLDDDIFIKGRSINESMHDVVANSILDQLSAIGKDLTKVKVAICGVAFKGNPETGDIRNSSAVEIISLLKNKIPNIYCYDAVALKKELLELGVTPVSIDDAFIKADAVLFLNNHKSFEKINIFEMTGKMNELPIVYDGWNLFRADDVLAAKPSVYMGLSFKKSSIK